MAMPMPMQTWQTCRYAWQALTAGSRNRKGIIHPMSKRRKQKGKTKRKDEKTDREGERKHDNEKSETVYQKPYAVKQKLYTPSRLKSKWVRGRCNALIIRSSTVVDNRGENLLACARLAFMPVACGVSFLSSGLTPNRTDGGGPVFCACKGAAVGC